MFCSGNTFRRAPTSTRRSRIRLDAVVSAAALQTLRLTMREPELSDPIVEVATIRRLGAEVVEYPIGDSHAIVGAHVRDLWLPRDAVVNVIVRGEEEIPPRGSTRLRAGDRLHILVRREVSSASSPARKPAWSSTIRNRMSSSGASSRLPRW